MNVSKFCKDLERRFPPKTMGRATWWYEYNRIRRLLDPCSTIAGMSSIKKMKLLNTAYSHVAPDECYLEIGTYLGKSLAAAMLKNAPRTTYACDNFTEFRDTSSEAQLMRNLAAAGLKDHVTFFNSDFRAIMSKSFIKRPIGVYLYDGAHDFDSQYEGLKMAEPLLADEALVIVDDWRYAPDSHSQAKAGTLRAVDESAFQFELLYELPARHNGDHAMWWNGVGVLAFYRRSKSLTQEKEDAGR